MTIFAKIQSSLTTLTAPGPVACSVLWLIPEADGELSKTMAGLPTAGKSPICRAILCQPANKSGKRKLQELFSRPTDIELRLESGGAGSFCESATIDIAHDANFWELFAHSTYQRQLLAGMFAPAQGIPVAWVAAAAQLALVAGSLQFWSLDTAHDSQDALLQSFLVETIAANAVAITKVAPELYTAGIALTGRPRAINKIERKLNLATRMADQSVDQCIAFGGIWPR